MPKEYVEFREGDITGWFLLFSKEWREKSLPLDGDNLDCLIADTKTGKIGQCKVSNAIEAYKMAGPDWDSGELLMLQPYFYQSHCCACRRKQFAQEAGIFDGSDSICEGSRFQFARITSPIAPTVILYSETMGSKLLDSLLTIGLSIA